MDQALPFNTDQHTHEHEHTNNSSLLPWTPPERGPVTHPCLRSPMGGAGIKPPISEEPRGVAGVQPHALVQEEVHL